MNFMDSMGAFGGLFGIIFSIIQTIVQMRQTKKNEMIQELQQQYQQQMNQFNTAYSQVANEIQMDNQYSYQYQQQNAQQNNQLFEGGAGANPTQAGTDRLQMQAEKSAKLASMYSELSKREKKLRNQLLTMRSRETNQYNQAEKAIYNGEVGYGQLLGNSYTSNGLSSFKNVSNNISDTINGWLNDVAQAADNVQQDNVSSLTAAYLQMQSIYKQINQFMNGGSDNGYVDTTITNPTQQQINNYKGDLWDKIIGKESITHSTKNMNVTMKKAESENFGMWKAKPMKKRNAITRTDTRRVKP